ncbi:MAG: alpha/beta hydrolase [Xanthomonadales bacterium]|nr:alpha/beta hydrolase [Xanthomonadales bacterium]
MILFFYGGTWRYGQREWYRFVGESLADHGFVVVIPDYRTAPDVTFPAFVEDAARAAAWTRGNAARLGADPQRMFLMGHSAGAHIAALLATDARWLAAVDASRATSAPSSALPGLRLPADLESAHEGSVPDDGHLTDTQPIHFVDGDEPPMLLLRAATRTSSCAATTSRWQRSPPPPMMAVEVKPTAASATRRSSPRWHATAPTSLRPCAMSSTTCSA